MTGTIVDVLALREAAGVALIRASWIREKEGNADEPCKSESCMREGSTMASTVYRS